MPSIHYECHREPTMGRPPVDVLRAGPVNTKESEIKVLACVSNKSLENCQLIEDSTSSQLGMRRFPQLSSRRPWSPKNLQQKNPH